MTPILYFSLFIFSAFVSFSLAFYAWMHRSVAGARAFTLASLLAGIWPLAQAIDIFTTDLALKILLMKIRLDTPILAAFISFIMVAQLLGQRTIFTRKRILLLSIVPAIGMILNWTSPNPFYRYNFHIDLYGDIPILQWSSGPLFWAWLAYGYALILAPLILLFRSVRAKSTISSRQVVILFLSGLALLGVNLLFQLGITPFPGLNLTPVIQPVMAMMVSLLFFRFYTVQISPLARNLLFDQMSDAVIVLDLRDCIVDMNVVARQVLGGAAENTLGVPIDEFLPQWTDLRAYYHNPAASAREFCHPNNPQVYFEAKSSPILDARARLAGHMLTLRNISDRKQTEQKLRDLEENFRQMAENIQEVFWVTDPFTKEELYINPAIEKIWGIRPEEFMTHPDLFLKSVLDEDKLRVEECLALQEQGQATDMEYRIQRRDGGIRWIWDRSIPVLDEGGKLRVVAGIMTDITARKQAQAALEFSEERYRVLVETAQDAIVVAELNGKIVMVNQQTASTFGFESTDEVLGRNLFDYVAPEDLPKSRQRFEETLHTGIAVTASEFTLLKKDGTRFFTEATTGVLKNAQGKIINLVAVVKDITGRKTEAERLAASESRYRGLFEDSPISLWEEDFSAVKTLLDDLHRSGVTDFREYFDLHPEIVVQCFDLVKIIDVNKVTLQMYGAASKTELIGRLSAILDSDDLSAFRDELIQIASGKSQFEWFGQNRTLTGKSLAVNMRWMALPGYETSLARVIISVTDITEIKNTERELNRQNEQLAALHHITLELLNRRKQDDLLKLIVEQAAVLLEAPYGELMLAEEDELLVHAYTGNMSFLRGDRVNRSAAKISWQAFDSGRPVVVDDYMALSGHRQVYDHVGLHAVADFPIVVGQRSVGVLALGRDMPGALFDAHQIKIGEQFAQLAALVLSNVQLMESTSLQAAALNATANAIAITDPRGVIQWVNTAFSSLTGYTSAEAIGQNPRILKSGRTPASRHEELWKTISGGNVWHGELYNRRKDGQEYIEEMTITPLLDEHGKIYRFIAVKQDISARKMSEEALRLSEEKYRSIFENVEDVFYTTDYHGCITTISPSIEKYSGFTPQEVNGRHVRNFFADPADYEKLDEAVSTLGALNDYEMVMKRKDGSTIYVSASARVVFDANGQPIGTEGVMRDITGRKQAEVREQQRRMLLEKVVEMSKVVAQAATFNDCLLAIRESVQGGLGFDRTGIFLYDAVQREVHGTLGTGRNSEVLEITQFTQKLEDYHAWEEALKSPKGFFLLDDYAAYHHVPEDSEMHGVKQNIIVSAWAGDKPVAFIAVDNLFTQRPFTQEQLEALQIFAGYAGLAIENAQWKNELEMRVAERTTRLQEANVNLSALVESAIALNKTLDLNEVLDHVLIQARTMVPCQRLSIMFREGDEIYVARYLNDTLISQADEDFLATRFSSSWPNFQHMIDTQEGVFSPNTVADPDWQVAPKSEWIRSYIGVPIIVDNETVGFLNASHDVVNYFERSDLQLLEALASHASIAIQNARLHGDLVKALENEQAIRAQLVHTDKLAALGKMVAVIAHEINNPIQTVKNAFFLIEDEIKPGSPAQEYLAIAKSEATRISDLVSQLRETYRTRSKTLTKVNLFVLITEVKNILLPQLRKSNVGWQQPDTFAPCTVFAIRNNLKQVFINLGLNAIEAMEMETGGLVTVSMTLSRDGRFVGVQIHNSGSIISEEDLPRIFEPFFTTKGSGSGLGLSISYDIVQQHGGKIEVESQPGKGVTFTVWLPLIQGSEEVQP